MEPFFTGPNNVDFAERTVSYYGCNGEVYLEAYSAVAIG